MKKYSRVFVFVCVFSIMDLSLLPSLAIETSSAPVVIDGIPKKKVRKTSSVKKVRAKKRIITPSVTVMAQTVGHNKLSISSDVWVMYNLSCTKSEIRLDNLMSPFPLVWQDISYSAGQINLGVKQDLSTDLPPPRDAKSFALTIAGLQPVEFKAMANQLRVNKPGANEDTVIILLRMIQAQYGPGYQVNVSLPHNCSELISKPFIDFEKSLAISTALNK